MLTDQQAVDEVFEVNIPLLRKGVEWVEEQDALRELGQNSFWDQEFWMMRRWQGAELDSLELLNLAQDQLKEHWCDSGMCFAGKIAFDAGWKPVYADDASEVADSATKEGVPGTSFIRAVAQKLLGLDWWEADRLFEGTNTAADIREIAEDLAGERL